MNLKIVDESLHEQTMAFYGVKGKLDIGKTNSKEYYDSMKNEVDFIANLNAELHGDYKTIKFATKDYGLCEVAYEPSQTTIFLADENGKTIDKF